MPKFAKRSGFDLPNPLQTDVAPTAGSTSDHFAGLFQAEFVVSANAEAPKDDLAFLPR